MRASEWIAALWHDRSGRTSAQVLSEYYFNVTRKLTPRVAANEAWDDAKALFAWRPHPVNEPLLTQAREIEQRWRLSWRDSMIVAAAQLQGCTLLLTEDLHDGAAFGSVTVRSPFTLGVRESVARSAVMPALVPRHRPRGRPAKHAA